MLLCAALILVVILFHCINSSADAISMINSPCQITSLCCADSGCNPSAQTRKKGNRESKRWMGRNWHQEDLTLLWIPFDVSCSGFPQFLQGACTGSASCCAYVTLKLPDLHFRQLLQNWVSFAKYLKWPKLNRHIMLRWWVWYEV